MAAARDTSKNIKWIDGLRGFASFTVVCTHLSRAFDYGLFLVRDNPEKTPRIVQWPFIRIIFQGKVGVAIFALLTGYVCALKPIKLARAGKHSDALSAIAKSAFRRPPRLMLPATIALLIAWTLAQCGGFITATRSSSDWLRYASPTLEPTLWLEIQRLYYNFWTTWTTGYMDYDDHQWALLPFLKGSMIVFVLIAGLIYTKFRFRMMAYIGFLVYWWQNAHPDTETFGQQMIFGTLLCDLALHPGYQQFLATHKKVATRCSIPLIILGFYFVSYPDAEPEWAAWSNNLYKLAYYIFPAEVHISKRYTALGIDLAAFGIQACHPMKEVLSNRFFLWLGKNSFAVYLIHGTLLRTVLAWMLYGIPTKGWTPDRNEAGEITGPWLPRKAHGIPFFMILAIWFSIVYYSAHLWTTYVDSFCGRLTKKLEDAVTLKDGEKEEEIDEKVHSAPLLGTQLPI